MSDYLSDLVTKNIGTADVIMPRRPTRFEPAQTTFAPESEIEPTSFQTDFFEAEQTIEPTPPARRREVRFIEKNEETSSRKDSFEQIEKSLLVMPTETRSSETKQTDTRLTLSPKIIEAPQATKEESSSISNLLSPTPLTPITPLQPPPKFVEKRENSNDTNEFTPIQTPRALPTEMNESKISPAKNSELQTIQAQDRIVIEPRVEKIENRGVQSTINQTIISPLQESKQISERAEVTEIPTINVTIGRVEVRAAVSSALPKQSQSKPQTLSLDEYLRKRRSGGER